MELNKHPLEPNPRNLSPAGANDQVYLTIQIGNGQIGGSKVFVGEQQLAKGNLTQPTLLGNASELQNKDIVVTTNVLDVNHFTNMCVITTSFMTQENVVLFSKIDNGEAPDSGVASFKGVYRLTIMTLIAIFGIFISPELINAQNATDKIALQSLETPASPGLILLDKAPSSIERPTTPQGFGVGVLGLLTGTGGAMEFAPFWLTNHEKLTAQKMYENRFPILYNLSISAATLKKDTSSYLATGLRTRLFQSYNPTTLAALADVKSKLEMALAELDPEKPDFKNIEKLQKQYAKLIESPILTIDFAAAIGGGSISNSFDDVAINRWSSWMTLNWRPKGNDFYVTAVGRYIKNDKFEKYRGNVSLVDVGARLNYDINKLCISVEYLQRFNMTQSSGADYRLAAIGSYQLSDKVYIVTTFGKNFTSVDNIIALAGFNFGMSNAKVKAF